MPFFFALTLFTSATLLFLVQPMIAKLILPTLGGTPAVWNTCMVFFQAALLAGYAYAHAATGWLGVRRQAALHAALLLVPLAVLPLRVAPGWTPPADANPIPWLLALLAVSVGLPFFVVSTSAPLLQKWFAATGHASARDPYFLYAASNLGSMLSLFGYPVVVEPFLSLADQGTIWTAGYVALILLTLGCALLVWRSPSPPGVNAPGSPDAPAEEVKAPTLTQKLRWIALAFVPSSLMLGATTFLTTDIAAIPLFWVLPLALYLLSFILVFAQKPILSHQRMLSIQPMVILLLVFLMLSGNTHQLSIAPTILVHLGALFVVAMACHGELARLRPTPRHLTEFFLWMSFGGMLGGLFNALAAPLLFKTVIEYPIALSLACLLMPPLRPEEQGRRFTWLDLALPVGLGALAAALTLGANLYSTKLTASGQEPGGMLGTLAAVFVNGLPALLGFMFVERPLRFGLGLGAILVASTLCRDPHGHVLQRERGFFGVMHVQKTTEAGEEYVQLFHGTTLHGQQSKARPEEPQAYFHRTGPIGQLFESLQGTRARSNVAVTGLGVGTLLAYATAGQRWTYYEIDPAVERLARDERFFTFVGDAERRGAEVKVVLGDARLRIVDAPAHAYDLLIQDVFSSDAVPVHLLTREALRVYLSKLADGGLLAFHISNRYLHLEWVLAALAEDAGLEGRVQYDLDNLAPGKRASIWVVLARRAADLGALAEHPKWRGLQGKPSFTVWTDDFSNLLSTFRWRN